MSCDLPNTTFCVIDHGFGLPIARRLAAEGSRVLYYTPWEKAYPVLNEAIIGDGFPEIERCNDFWSRKNEIDVFVFPDVYHQGLQQELRSQGKAVWGAGNSMRLELDRMFFLKTLKDLGLDVPKFDVVTGVSALAEYLWDKENVFIKISRWRGSWETTHWHNRQQDGHRLEEWAVKFGGVKERVRFLCFAQIDTMLELGCDTFNINGQWPKTVVHGIEKKDAAYFAAVTKLKEMPEEITHIMHAFSPVLKELGYACQWAMEVRVADEGNFFIDATTRMGLPSTASQLINMKNFSEVVYHGANGEMTEPDYEKEFTAECMVKIHGGTGVWETILLDPELKKNFMALDCCMVDGQIWYPADEKPIEELGWLVATGDTPTECAKEMNRLADLLPDGADAAVEELADIIREIEEAEDRGIKFTDQPMPEPEVVLEDA
jgi:hypothetical protein